MARRRAPTMNCRPSIGDIEAVSIRKSNLASTLFGPRNETDLTVHPAPSALKIVATARCGLAPRLRVRELVAAAPEALATRALAHEAARAREVAARAREEAAQTRAACAVRRGTGQINYIAVIGRLHLGRSLFEALGSARTQWGTRVDSGSTWVRLGVTKPSNTHTQRPRRYSLPLVPVVL